MLHVTECNLLHFQSNLPDTVTSLTGVFGASLGRSAFFGSGSGSGSGSGECSASAPAISASCLRLSSSSSQIPARLSSSRRFCLPRSAAASENKRNIINDSFTANSSTERGNRALRVKPHRQPFLMKLPWCPWSNPVSLRELTAPVLANCGWTPAPQLSRAH